MTNAMTIPAVSLQQGRAVTSSRDVADLFVKRHADVLRAVDGLECSPEFTQRNFASCEIPHPTVAGRYDRAFNMTKDGFVFLAMGFTGVRAAQFKEAYINRFNELEASRGEAHWIEGQQACGVAHLPHERIPLT